MPGESTDLPVVQMGAAQIAAGHPGWRADLGGGGRDEHRPDRRRSQSAAECGGHPDLRIRPEAAAAADRQIAAQGTDGLPLFGVPVTIRTATRSTGCDLPQVPGFTVTKWPMVTRSPSNVSGTPGRSSSARRTSPTCAGALNRSIPSLAAPKAPRHRGYSAGEAAAASVDHRRRRFGPRTRQRHWRQPAEPRREQRLRFPEADHRPGARRRPRADRAATGERLEPRGTTGPPGRRPRPRAGCARRRR